MINIRDLPEDEWDQLPPELPRPPSGSARFVIAEDNGQIVAYWTVVLVPHIEPVWIHPSYRGTTLAGRLWRKVLAVLDGCGLSHAYCFSERSDTSDYLQRLGLEKQPYETFLLTRSCPTPPLP